MKLFLNGGGSGEQVVNAIQNFEKSINKKKPLLYIPLAMEEGKYDGCLIWLKNEMKFIGITNIVMVRSKEELFEKNYHDYCALFIGGGNTYKLLKDIKESGSFSKIKQYLEEDGIVFGGSAGAIIFGNNIDTCKYSDDNKVINLKDTLGFNLIHGYSLLCHYKEVKEKTIKNIEFIKNEFTNSKIIYLAEESTIIINDDKISITGNKEYCIIDNGIDKVILSNDKNNIW